MGLWMPVVLATSYGNYGIFTQKSLVRPAKCTIEGGSNAENSPPSAPLNRLPRSLSGNRPGDYTAQPTTAV